MITSVYGNELTGLCRPEELMRLIDYARGSPRCGVKIDSAMISDVPGYTWGLTSVLGRGRGQVHCRSAPILRDRMRIHLGDLGRQAILLDHARTASTRSCAGCPARATTGHSTPPTPSKQLSEMLRRLEAKGYPYDMVQIRYCLGDNAGPAVELCEMVKKWNATHASPKLIIATTSEMMQEFERRYADKIPEVRGDFTPYWEDGAGSSARETAINRNSAERLVQAETLFAMLDPAKYSGRAVLRRLAKRSALRRAHLGSSTTASPSPTRRL